MREQITPGYLIDTNILSELSRKKPDAGVLHFFANTPRIEVSTLLFHELTYGVESASAQKRPKLSAFVATMRGRFGARAIPVTLDIAEMAGHLRASEKSKGRVLTATDSIMAATAMVSGAVLVTRNVRDFAGLELQIVNPFSAG